MACQAGGKSAHLQHLWLATGSLQLPHGSLGEKKFFGAAAGLGRSEGAATGRSAGLGLGPAPGLGLGALLVIGLYTVA